MDAVQNTLGLYSNASPVLVQKYGVLLREVIIDDLKSWPDMRDPEGSVQQIIAVHEQMVQYAMVEAEKAGAGDDDVGLAMVYPLKYPEYYHLVIQSGDEKLMGAFTANEGFPRVSVQGSPDNNQLVVTTELGNIGNRHEISMTIPHSRQKVVISVLRPMTAAVGLSSPKALASVLLKVRFHVPNIYADPNFYFIRPSLIRQWSSNPAYRQEPVDGVVAVNSFIPEPDRTPTWQREISRRIEVAHSLGDNP